MADLEIFLVALRNLRYQGLRTYLTLLGVVIGIAAIVAFLSIGAGLTISISEQLQQLGSNMVFIIPLTGAQFQSLEEVSITDSDLRRIEAITEVETVIPFYSATAIAKKGIETRMASIFGFDPDKAEELGGAGVYELKDGRDFSEKDVFVVMVGETFAETAFSRELKPKSSIYLNDKKFEVIGILKNTGQSFGAGAPSTDNSIFTTEKALKRAFDVTTPNIIFAKTFSVDDVEIAKEKIQNYLDRKHGEKNFFVITSEQVVEQVGQIFGLISLFLAGIAGISLVVGGVGIMNSMVTSVLERTKEIGILKAVGATNRKILSIILIESGFIGLIGGMIGLILGYLTALGISFLASTAGFYLPVFLTPQLIVGVLLFAMFVGMLSGLYPAWRAATLDPVDALRAE